MAGQLVGYLRVSSTDQNSARQVKSIGVTDRNFTDYASGGSSGRLASSTHDPHELIRYFTGDSNGVEFMKDGLEIGPGGDASPMGQLMLAMLGAIAQFERALSKGTPSRRRTCSDEARTV